MTSYTLTFVYLLIGGFAGFLGGLLGVGGGVIVVPALIFLFEYLNIFPIAEYESNALILFALGTSMASIVFTTTSSTISQIRRNNLAWDNIKNWLVFLILGAFSASFLVRLMPVHLFKLFLAGFIVCVATVMLSGWLPIAKGKQASLPFTATVGSGIGLVSGLAGIGGGNMFVPTLLYLNTPMIRATAAGSVAGVAISLFGTTGYVINGYGIDHPYSLGYIYIPALVPIAIANIAFAPLGVRLAQQLQANILRRVFGIALLLVSCSLLLDIFMM